MSLFSAESAVPESTAAALPPSRATTRSDGAIAYELQREEHAAARQQRLDARIDARNAQLLRRHDLQPVKRDDLRQPRSRLLVLLAADFTLTMLLLLAQRPPDSPLHPPGLEQAWDSQLVRSNAWFVPAILLICSQLVAGVGALYYWRRTLVGYSCVLFCAMATRLLFLYRASFREGLDDRLPLLIDMLLLTAGISVQIFELQYATLLSLLLMRMEMRVVSSARAAALSGTHLVRADDAATAQTAQASGTAAQAASVRGAPPSIIPISFRRVFSSLSLHTFAPLVSPGRRPGRRGSRWGAVRLAAALRSRVSAPALADVTAALEGPASGTLQPTPAAATTSHTEDCPSGRLSEPEPPEAAL